MTGATAAAADETDSEQRLIRRRWWTTRPFYAGVVLAVVLLAFDVLQANQTKWKRLHDWPWNIHVPGVDVGIALLIGSVGWLLLRDHNARSTQPALEFDSRDITGSDWLPQSGAYRQVVLTVGGQGPALFRHVSWVVRGVADRSDEEVRTMRALHARLSKLGLTERQDYAITNVTQGARRNPGKHFVYFECTTIALKLFAKFEAVFTFESMVGDTFLRKVSLLPYEGAPTVETTLPPPSGPAL